MNFGPTGAAGKANLAGSALRTTVPALRDFAGLVRYIRRERIDLIHCEQGSRNAFYAWALCRVTRARYVVHFHWKYGSWMSALSRFAVQRAHGHITVSSWTGRVMAEAGIPSERIFPVLNGIDLDHWQATETPSGDIRCELGLTPEAPIVVMVAQLIDWKRQTTMIDAFRDVVAHRPDARLLLVGKEWTPSGEPNGYTEQLQTQITGLGLEQHVHLLGFRRDVRAILNGADIFALPSIDDPCALAHIEAMAMAKPIVTVDAGGAPELVQHGRTGLVGPVDDSAQLATNILTLIENASQRQEMGDHGYSRVVDYLNAKRMADDVEAVYRNVLNRG